MFRLPGIRSPKRPLNRREAVLCLLVNIAACPGAGTFYARRWTGLPQLLLAGAGFGLFLGVYGWYFLRLFEDMEPPPLDAEAGRWLTRALVLFGAAWVWSLASGLCLLRDTLPLTDPPPDRAGR